MRKNYSKRFGAWATGLKGNLFLYARLRLSAQYLFAMTLVIGLYSTALFFSLRRNIVDDFEDRFPQAEMRAQAVSGTLHVLEDRIFLTDAFVLALIGLLSYLLAGRTLRPIAAALEEQRKFTSNASHELRTPLTVMRTGLEVALKSRQLPPEEVRELLASNLEEINRMSGLIEELLLVSRGQAKKMAFERVDLSALTERVLAKMAPLAGKKDISVSFSSVPGMVSGQASLLERMAVNIINNAIAYTPPGGKVAVDVRPEGGAVAFRVNDTGVGIAAQHVPHVFDRFYRAPGFHENGGAGLGLSIVKEIVGLHNGRILLNSLPGKGTEVRITLPGPRA